MVKIICAPPEPKSASWLLVEIVNHFLTDCPKLQAALEGAIATRDCLALERAAHSLAGSAANFGAEALVNQARLIEGKARSGDLTGVDSDWVSLSHRIQEFLPELHALRSTAGKDGTP